MNRQLRVFLQNVVILLVAMAEFLLVCLVWFRFCCFMVCFLCVAWFLKLYNWAQEQEDLGLKALASRPDDLCCIPRTHMVEEES